METTVAGGYVLVTVGQLANVCAARKEGTISFLAVRVWLATLEQRMRRRSSSGAVHFNADELRNLVNCSHDRVQRAIRELVRERLLRWTETEIEHPAELSACGAALAQQLGTSDRRLIPLPRR